MTSPHPQHRKESGSSRVLPDDSSTPRRLADDSPADDPTADESGAKAAQRARAEKIGRIAAIFIMPLAIVGMMITGYLGTMHSPKPHDLPVVVAGSGAEAQTLARALSETHPDALDVQFADSPTDARDRVVDRKAGAAVIVDGEHATFHTATAAGASQATVVTSLVMPVLTAEGLDVTSQDLVPLPPNDLSGLGAMFLGTALVMAGYLPFSTLRSNSPELLKFRRIVPLLAAWAAVIATLVWTVTGPILGVVPSEHYLEVLGIAWLGVFAISCVQLFITRLFGPLGVIAGMFLLMVLGMPSSNMSLSMYTMPSFYRVLHEFLPMAAIGESMRSVLYFDGNGVTEHLLVLAAGAVFGLAATSVWDAFRGHRHPEGVPTDVTMPSLHGGRRPRNNVWRYLSLAFFPLAMVTMMITCMLGAMHQPSPRNMPVAVIGATAEQADQTVAGLQQKMGTMYDFSTFSAADSAQVAMQVENREIVAALELPSQSSPEFTLVANQAGNPSAYQVAVRTFSQVAAAQQLPLRIDNTSPLPDRDSQGVVTMYLSMGWMLAGFMVVIVAANAAPMVRPLKRMLPIAAVYSVMMSAVLWLIAGPITGSIDGHFAELWGAGAVAILCVSMFAMFLERLLGMLAVIPAVGTLMFLGVPSSNGALSMYLTPEGFRTLHDFLPMPAAVETIRSILYFGGDVAIEHLQVLGLWGLVSLALVFVVDSVKTVRTEHDFGDLVQPGGSTEPGAVTSSKVATESQPGHRTIGDGSSRDPEPVGA